MKTRYRAFNPLVMKANSALNTVYKSKQCFEYIRPKHCFADLVAKTSVLGALFSHVVIAARRYNH